MKFSASLLSGLALLFAMPAPAATDSALWTIHANRAAGDLRPFWKATGFTPATLLDEPAMRASLRRLAETEPRGIEYLRPHYLLDLVAWRDGAPVWDGLDRALDVLVRDHGFKLVFEVMGNPSGRFDFTRTEDLAAWSDFVRDLARRLQSRYGAAEVRGWWFECWNEPDEPGFWPHGEAAFFAYYDATWRGLKAADPALRFGGPANAKGLNDLFRNWAAHVATGPDAPRADFVSVHRKFPASEMIKQERRLIDHLRAEQPALARLPFLNTEADPEWGWADRHWWRGHPWYAAFVVQSVDLHLRLLRDRDGVDYALGLNDHGFLGGFGERTLFASFPSAEGEPPAVVKKPVAAVKELLARLGPERLAFEGAHPHAEGRTGLIATRHADGRLALLVYDCPDIGNPRLAGFADPPALGPDLRIVLRLSGLPAGAYALHERVLDSTQGNPLALWLAAGRPERPSAKQLAAMHAAEGPVVLPPRSVSRADANTSLELPVILAPASVRLFELTPSPAP